MVTQNEFRIEFDQPSGWWSIKPNDGRIGHVFCRQLILDVPARVDGDHLVAAGIMQADGLANVTFNSAVADKITVIREHVPEGVINPDPMLEWQVRYDLDTQFWVIARADRPIVVTTKKLRLDCHAESRGDRLMCVAEMILNGATNKVDMVSNAGDVLLRTLRVFNQEIPVPTIMAGAKAKRPRSGRG